MTRHARSPLLSLYPSYRWVHAIGTRRGLKFPSLTLGTVFLRRGAWEQKFRGHACQANLLAIPTRITISLTLGDTKVCGVGNQTRGAQEKKHHMRFLHIYHRSRGTMRVTRGVALQVKKPGAWRTLLSQTANRSSLFLAKISLLVSVLVR